MMYVLECIAAGIFGGTIGFCFWLAWNRDES